MSYVWYCHKGNFQRINQPLPAQVETAIADVVDKLYRDSQTVVEVETVR